MPENTSIDPLAAAAAGNTPPPPESSPPAAPKQKGPALKKTGTYVTPAGLGTAEIRVFVIGDIKDGKANLARTKDARTEDCFVTGCPHSDEPKEGHWTSD